MDGDKYNIYRIDDALIKVGYVFLVLCLLTGGTAISNMVKKVSPDQSESLYAAGVMLLLPSAVFLLTGYSFRRKEKVAAAILHKMEMAREAPVTDLMTSTGYSRRMVERSLLLINRRGLGYYVLDRGSDRIVDGRLRRNMVMVERCDRCGSTISLSFPASSAEPPKCPYCGVPIAIDLWNEMRNKVMEDIRNQETREIPATVMGPGTPPPPRDKPPFSLPIFVLLLLLFWPAAIAYAVTRYH